MGGYYLQDNPNPNTEQFGWPRKKVSGVIGVHTAENNTDFEGADPGAEDVARFIGRRTDYGSYHAIADADSRLKLIHPSFAAWADTTNNAHALSVSGAMQAARWRELTPARAAAITRNMAIAAADLVKDATAAGLLKDPTPARRITPAEAIAGSRAGFYGHGETNPGRRYDPGQNFDWDLFLTTYAGAIGGGLTNQGSTSPEEDDIMTGITEDRLREIVREEVGLTPKAWFVNKYGTDVQFESLLGAIDLNINQNNDNAQAKLDRLVGEVVGLRAAVTALAGGTNVSAEQVEAAIKDALSGFSITLTAAGGE